MSPESANLGRYGNVALNNATGQMNYSVPIYNIEVDGNSWPIALNYNYGGLILEGKPSLSGLGWNLSAYANITKETRGLPDGHSNGYYGSNNIKEKIDSAVSDYLNDGVFNQTSFWDLKNFSEGRWDSEVDKYTVNIKGMSFSFKLRKTDSGNYVPYYLSKHNYKVEITEWLDSQFSNAEVAAFKVIDDSGIQYFFNKEHREQYIYDPGNPNSPFWEDRTTAWLLSEIKYLNGQSILFKYRSEHFFSYDFWAYGHEKDLDISEPGQNQGPGPNDTSYGSHFVQSWFLGYKEGIRQSEMDRLILESIEFPQGSIELLTTGVDYETLFSELKLKDHKQRLVDHYKFEYEGNRDNLITITKNDEIFYEFDYYSLNGHSIIPEFMNSQNKRPHDQDYWRYYNNAGNSTAIDMPFDGKQTNKLPNLVATRAGALHRIKYQTGGYTEVFYEQNEVKEDYDDNPTGNNQNQAFNQSFLINVDAKVDNNDRYASVRKTFNTPVRAALYHKIRGNVEHGNSIYLSILRIGDVPATDYSACYSSDPANIPYYPIAIEDARKKVRPSDDDCPLITYPNPIIAPSLLIEHDPDNHCAWFPGSGDDFSESMGCVDQKTINANDSSRGDFWIPPGTYQFKIEVKHLFYDKLYGEIGMRWFDPTVSNGGEIPEFINTKVGGIRVATIIDYNENGERTNIKHYDYNDDDGFSTGRLNQTPYFKNEHLWHHNRDGQSWTHKLDEYLLNSYTALNRNHGTPVLYSRIKTHNTKKLSNSTVYPNGYTIKEYALPIEELNDDYPRVPKGQDISKATPSNTFIKDTDDESVSSNSRTYYPRRELYLPLNYYSAEITESLDKHTDNNFNHPWSFKYYKKLENDVNWDCDCYNAGPHTLNSESDLVLKDLHAIKLYKDIDIEKVLDKEEDRTQGLSLEKNYDYDALSGLFLKKIKTINSDGEETVTEFDYPNEVSEPQYTGMVNRNQLTTPVVQRVLENGELISKQKTNFTLLNNGYRPYEILAAKGNTDLKREINFNYNSKGQINQKVNNEGASPYTSYLWGYNQTVPIAKIDNATYTEVLNNLPVTYNALQSLEGPNLRTALNSLRSSLPGAQVTSYTYSPLIGVFSITDPKNETVFYNYDDLNRLEFIKDKDEKILKEYKYHFAFSDISVSLISSATTVQTGDTVNFEAIGSGGSDDYKYKWTISNFRTGLNQEVTTTSNTYSVTTTSNHSPSFSLSCEIIDNETNLSHEVSRIIRIDDSVPPLNLGNINATRVTPAVGQSVSYSINVSGGSGSYRYQWTKSSNIGAHNFGGNSRNVSNTTAQSDCSNYTVFCTVTDLVTNETKRKTISLSVSSGCPTDGEGEQ